jgi:hypothetical protein
MQNHGVRKWRELLIGVRKSGANDRFSTARPLGHERVWNRRNIDTHLTGCEGPVSVSIPLKKSVLSGSRQAIKEGCAWVDEVGGSSCHRDERRRGDQLGEFSQVLGGGGEVELVAGAVRSA